MTSLDIKNRIEKLTTEISKKENLLKKYESKRDKFFDMMNGDINNMENEYYWDYHETLDNIKHTYKAIESKKNTLVKAKKSLEKCLNEENIFSDDMPDCMKKMVEELLNNWNEFDKNRHEFLRKECSEIGYHNFLEKYWGTPSVIHFYEKSIDKIMIENEREAKNLIINLYQRIYEITGEVISWNDIQYNINALNGVVYGKNGNVRVESIYAGGYNVQRLHVRVLVHKF